MHTILVTGGLGFIGSNLIKILLRQKFIVINVDKVSYSSNFYNTKNFSNNRNYKFIKCDLRNKKKIKNIFNKFKPNCVFNLAAETHVDRSIDSPKNFIDSNIYGTFNLLECFKKYSNSFKKTKLIHISTDEVYGSLGATGSFTEESRYDPRSPYSASKASSDHLARSWHATFGLPVIVTNCSNNFGPFQFPEKLIPLTIVNALSRKNLPVYGTGKNIRDWIYVEDHARALYQVAMQGVSGESYNIGGRNEKSNIDVVNAICQILNSTQDTDEQFDYRELIYFVEDRPGHDFRYSIDNTKIERDLRWSPEETFESGLKKTVDWYLENRQWCASISQNYNQERLGLTTTEL